MREILFRGKRICNGKMMFGSLFCCNDGDCYIVADDFHRSHYRVEPETVGQFTGLTDKNGKKIFEGDIVEVNHDTYPGARGEVFFRNGSFMLKKISDVLSLYGFLPWCEVIGNIHDNPELLEVE